MIYFAMTVLAWIYLYVWNLSICRFKYNKEHLLETIILIVLFLPIELVLLSLLLTIEIVLWIFAIILFPFKNNPLYKLLEGFNSVIKDAIKNYVDCVQVINILNETDENHDYYRVANINLLANYFVSILKCHVSMETFEEIMKDFLVRFNNGTSVIEWIAQDKFVD